MCFSQGFLHNFWPKAEYLWVLELTKHFSLWPIVLANVRLDAILDVYANLAGNSRSRLQLFTKIRSIDARPYGSWHWCILDRKMCYAVTVIFCSSKKVPVSVIHSYPDAAVSFWILPSLYLYSYSLNILCDFFISDCCFWRKIK